MKRIAGSRRRHVVVMSLGLTLLGLALYGLAGGSNQPDKDKPVPAAKGKTWDFAAFEERLLKHQDLTYDGLTEKIRKPRKYVETLSFDPTKAEFFDRVADKLKLTPDEIDIFKKAGFVSLDMNARHSMVSAYHEVFKKDLPILVTTDSILNALHRSFDKILMELEQAYFYQALNGVINESRQELRKVVDAPPAGLADNCKDVDLFLTVAGNFLHGAGAKDDQANWDGKLRLETLTGGDKLAVELLKNAQNQQLVRLGIYGGVRPIDFTQFAPRGHYTKSDTLKRYFRAMMWFGRADTGWFILPVDPQTRIQCDDERELRNAMLLVHCLEKSGSLTKLKQLDDAINFLVGRSDNVSAFQLHEIMKAEGIASPADIAAAGTIKKMQQALRDGKHTRPMIVSLVLHSDMRSRQVAAPAQFHMFGQRFAIDSFVLSQVVFDTITFKGRKMERRLPTGLDAMVALGNGEALPLLKDELEKWQHSANLLACREFVDGVSPDFWKDSLYNVWLDSLRTFNADRTGEKHFPQVMKTQAWQRKETHTQLASWAELRHDTVLYVKQSYSRASCEYPAGYVEPYPEFYAKIRAFTDKAQVLFANWNMHQANDTRPKYYEAFFKNFSEQMAKLENLARKELRAEAFSKEETEYVKKTLFSRPNCDGTPLWDGWFCRLHIDPEGFEQWEPTIVDVHTDPMTAKCLQVGVGEANLCVIAIDNEQHRRVYVGPIYSYYEFPHPMNDRMTDEAWKKLLEENRTPARLPWTSVFQGAQRPPAPTAKKR